MNMSTLSRDRDRDRDSDRDSDRDREQGLQWSYTTCGFVNAPAMSKQ